MEEVTVRFHHKVGAIVKHRLDEQSRFLIVERQMAQCTGGVQKFYVCQSRHFQINRRNQLYKLSEIEVEGIDDGKDTSRGK